MTMNTDLFQVTFWQSSPSPHQAAYIRALARLPQIEHVRAVFTHPLEQCRLSMGWTEGSCEGVDVCVAQDEAKISDIFERSGRNSIHLFSSIISDSEIWRIYRTYQGGQWLTGLVSEGRDWRGLFGALRQFQSLFYERRLSNDLDFVLAIGHMAHTWYRNCGFPDERVFDFCYVVEDLDDQQGAGKTGVQSQNDPVRLFFVGQLIDRKGVDLLLRALSILSAANWHLTVIGDGPTKGELLAQVHRSGLDGKVEFFPFLKNREVRMMMSGADILVLPSHWDGWGAVVNEALAAGARVLCSSFCGASDLIISAEYGEVFESGSQSSLASALTNQINKGQVHPQEREKIRGYSKSFSAPFVAAYLEKILRYVCKESAQRPLAPWKGK